MLGFGTKIGQYCIFITFEFNDWRDFDGVSVGHGTVISRDDKNAVVEVASWFGSRKLVVVSLDRLFENRRAACEYLAHANASPKGDSCKSAGKS